MERLQKVMAQAGIASRRACEDLIRQGRVQVNGQVVTEMGTKVDPARDRIAVDGQPLTQAAKRVYLVLNKPPGYLSTAHDDRGRPTVMDLVPGGERLYPVGRLDADSEGLLLLTNDGSLTQRLTHPRYQHEKEYLVLVRGRPSPETLRQLREGIELEDGRTSPARVVVLRREERESLDLERPPRGTAWLRMILREGRKRQIRRMCATVGHPVQRLIRVRMGPLTLGELPPGQWRRLSKGEIRALAGK